jgi:hypothetical protein
VILPWPTVRSSSHVLGGRALCTASVRSEVQAGHAVRVKFTLRNVSRHPVELSQSVFSTSVALKAADATTVMTTPWLPKLGSSDPSGLSRTSAMSAHGVRRILGAVATVADSDQLPVGLEQERASARTGARA